MSEKKVSNTGTREEKGTGNSPTGNKKVEDDNLVGDPLLVLDLDHKEKPATPPPPEKIRKKAIAATAERIKDTFAIASVYVGDEWAIDDIEAQTIADPLLSCMDMIHPDAQKIISKWSPPASLAVSVALIIMPRVMIMTAKRKAGKIGPIVNKRDTGEQPGHIDKKESVNLTNGYDYSTPDTRPNNPDQRRPGDNSLS